MSPTRNRRPRASARLTALAETAERLPAGVAVAHRLPGGQPTLVAANPALKQLLGYAAETPEDEIELGPLVRSVEHTTGASMAALFLAPGGLVDYPLRLRRPDGTQLWIEVSGSARLDESGMIVFEALVRDVSHRRRMDDQSRDLHEQLVQADKMAALGQAISGVAHELNNPLATILSWAERLSERELDEQARRGVDVVLGEAERAARIVRNLLTFARKRQSTRAQVDVSAVVRDTLALRAPDQAAHDIDVRTELAAALPGVFADSYQIQQVLLNLIINAEQAMRASHGRGVLTVRTMTAGDAVRIEVDDDGPGIPAEVRARIFDPFYTTKRVGEGTGLGLSVAYALVQEHGGQITVDAAPGGGARFRVDLPASQAVQGTTRRSVTAPSLEDVKGSTVLLVEDEQALAFAVAEGLRDAGLDVTYASGGAEALAHLSGRRFDLVVCDLKMPDTDGFEVARQVARMSAPPPMIFVTGDSADPDAEQFLAEPGRRWLAKPFRLGDLLVAVRQALRPGV